MVRKIVHVDMDAFYASVEQRDRPELRGKPVIVGGTPSGRGVVCTASYEARRYGIRSAMPATQAARLCPDGVFLRPDFERYLAVSRQVREIFHRFTDLVEPLSLDEAHLDVTENKVREPSATRIAEAIRAAISGELHLTASAGVAPNKFVAKVASDVNKPDGLLVVPPSAVEAFVRDLPVRRIPGVGPVTERSLKRVGIRTCRDFLDHDEQTLREWFGPSGRRFRNLARGIDPRPVEPNNVRKSVSIEDTFGRDLESMEESLVELDLLCERLAERLIRHDLTGRTVTLKVRYDDFRTVTRSRTLDHVVREKRALVEATAALVTETEIGRRAVRLIGVGVSGLEGSIGGRQGTLGFGAPARESGG